MGTLDPTATRWVTSTRLASFTALLLIVASCGGQAVAAPEGQPSASPASATATPETGPTETTVATQVSPQREPAATALEAARAFADALVSGDLTALTLSFAPAGLMQARELAARSGNDSPQVASADIHASERLGGQPEGWTITFVVQSDAGDESYFETRWQAFPDVGWRIVSLDTGN